MESPPSTTQTASSYIDPQAQNTPGPGEYSIPTEKSSLPNTTGSSSFASNTKRMQAEKQTKTPGPGKYRLSAPPNHLDVTAPFRSSTKRDFELSAKGPPSPGPGYYDGSAEEARLRVSFPFFCFLTIDSVSLGFA
jgi:hypothetical protein